MINANLPLWVKLADIACKGGDIITVSAWCQVDEAYGIANDPSLVLDRGDGNGVESEQTFTIAAADTWSQATISDKTVTGANAVYLGPVEELGEARSGAGSATMQFVCWCSDGSSNPISIA